MRALDNDAAMNLIFSPSFYKFNIFKARQIIQHFTLIQEAERGSSYDGAPSDIAGPLGGDDHWFAIFELGALWAFEGSRLRERKAQHGWANPSNILTFKWHVCRASCQLVSQPRHGSAAARCFRTQPHAARRHMGGEPRKRRQS